MVSRVCLDLLRSRKSRREDPIDTWVPDPVVSRLDPEGEVLQADAVGLAMLVVLEALSPAERIAFVLHDLFAVSFDEIGADPGQELGSDPAARQSGASAGPGGADRRRRCRAAARGDRRVPRRVPDR